MLRSRPLFAVATFVAALCLPSSVRAYETFRVAATGQATPDGGSTFASFSPPAFRDLVVVFRATTTDGWEGIYAGSSSLTRVATLFTPAPDGGVFTRFGDGPDVSDGVVVFQGGGITDFFSGDTFEGIYAYAGSSIVKIADTNTAVPDSTDTFSSFGPSPRIRGVAMIFQASTTAGDGLYGATPSSLVRLADTSTPMPDHPSETFAVFHGTDVTNLSYTFVGESATGFRGVYVHRDGTLRKVADAATLRPDGSGSFGTIGTDVSLHNGNVVFTSGDSVYAEYDGALVKIADRTMNPPSYSEPFTAFISGIELEGYGTVFSATAGARSGLYLGNGGSLWTIRDNSELLDSKTVSSFQITNEALDDELLAYQADFTDGSAAIYATRYVRVPVGSWFRPAQQKVRGAGSGGFQVLHYNFTLGTSFVTPYAEAPATAEIPLSRGQWAGVYFYDYGAGRFTQALYRLAQSPL